MNDRRPVLDQIDDLVGLKNYERLPVSDAAHTALVDLYRRGWMYDGWSLCKCGRRIHTGNGILCKSCTVMCDHRPIRGYIIKRDGRAAPRQYCGWCGAQQSDPPKGYPDNRTWIYDLCFKDLREQCAPEPCQRCGATTGTQLRHWAPSAIFEDAECWPTAWLCPECHEFWHQTMREAGAYRYPDGRRVAISHQRTPGARAQP